MSQATWDYLGYRLKHAAGMGCYGAAFLFGLVGLYLIADGLIKQGRRHLT